MTSPVDINPDHLDIVCNILREHLPPNVRVWVFGSRAKWATTDASDLDLALDGSATLNRDTITMLETAFEESDLPYKVDIVDLGQISSNFRRIIETHKVLLYKHHINNNNWKWIPISDVATIVIGGTPNRNIKKYWHGKIPWATAKDVSSAPCRYLDQAQEYITEQGLASSAAKLMPKGTIIITARGTVGALTQLGQNMAFNQTCYAIIQKYNICQNFLFYALKGTLHHMRALTYGTIFKA